MKNCAPFRSSFVLRVLVAAMLTGTGFAASADTLLIDRVQREGAMERPSRGMTMSQVRARYGEPMAELGTVGGGSTAQPPITRWSYDGYIVYFEHDHVVYSVPQRTTAYEQGPKPAE